MNNVNTNKSGNINMRINGNKNLNLINQLIEKNVNKLF